MTLVKKGLLIDTENNYVVPWINPASNTLAGIVQVDGTSIVADANGIISVNFPPVMRVIDYTEDGGN